MSPAALPADGPVHGRVDGDGRLVAADAALAALQARAGGEPDGPLAVPQIAALVRLARRLGTPVSRAVFAADGEEDLDLWVRARPDGAGAVALTLAGWTRRPAAPPIEVPAAHDRLRVDALWTWECDAALRLTAVSHEGLAALARDGGVSAMGDALTRLMALEEDGAAPPPLLAALAGGHGFDDQIVTIREGGARYRLAGEPVVDPFGRFRGFRGVAHPVSATGVAPASAPVADGGAFAIRLDAALRTPLQRIVATAEAIREQEDGPLRSDYGAYAGDIASAGRHLLGLVDDLVDLEAVERDDLAVEREPLDLADLARRAAGLLAVRADDKAMRILRPDEGDRLAATGDFRRALQVLVNLVGNAVRYGPDGSTVTVSVETRDATACAVVIDEGRGIAPEDRERVFEKFERLGAREPGSGLGLYISRRLARAMGGDVTIESAAGEGARFVFTLPG